MAIHPLVLVDGPPRCGKSTLARQLAASSSAGAILARAGSPDGRRIMTKPLELSAARPVILDGATMDEARTLEKILAAQPSAEPSTRSPARPSTRPFTENSAQAVRLPRFVLVGGPFSKETRWAAPETRITSGSSIIPNYPVRTSTITARLSLGPLTLAEVGRGSVRTHWLRGGYPEAYAATSDSAAMENLENLIAGISGGLLSSWGLPASPTRLTTLLAGLAKGSRGQVNENELARLLGASRPTVCRWMERLELAGILRRVLRLPGQAGARRTAQTPAWHIRDSGLIHCLLGMSGTADLRSSPRLATASWQAYVLEQTAAVIGPGTELGSYLSADGACIELVLMKDDRILAATTRLHLPGSPGKGASLAAQATGATDRRVVVLDGTARYIGGGFRTTGLADFLDEVYNTYG